MTLTPSPSPIRWERVAGERGNHRLRDGQFDADELAAQREMFLPLPEGEGWGEGETDDPTTGCEPIVASAGGSPEWPRGFEPFIVSGFRLCLRSLVLSILCLGLNPVEAGDWRQFRGPNANGVANEIGLPILLDQHKSIAWKADLPGRGLSSPIVVGDRVFVTCSSGPKQERLHVICFSASDGSKRWERQFWATGRTMAHEKTSVAAPTPFSDGERLFAFFSSADLVCLDLDGNLVWFRGLNRDYPNASNSLGMSSSLVAADGVVVVQVENDSESFAAGLDALTGINRWKNDRPKKVNWTSPILFKDAAGKSFVALQSSAGIHVVEPATGQEIWKYTDGASTIPSSALSGTILFVPSHGLTALQHEKAGEPPRQLWRSGQLRPATASPVVLGDRVFVLNDAGVLTCGEAATGKRLWQLRLKGPFSATPVGAGQYLYAVNEKGLAQVVDTAKPEGEVLSELDLGDVILSTPSIASGAIYIRSDGKLWKIAGALKLSSR